MYTIVSLFHDILRERKYWASVRLKSINHKNKNKSKTLTITYLKIKINQIRRIGRIGQILGGGCYATRWLHMETNDIIGILGVNLGGV